MTELRQRQPRQKDEGYLKWLRTKGCCCGCRSTPPSDPAHIRAASFLHDKPITGIGRKPDDRWALPLRRRCHIWQHAFGSEVEWWAVHGVDPFKLAKRYYAAYLAETGRKPADAATKRKPRKANPAKKRTTGHGWPKKSRKIINRGFSKRSKP